MLPFFFCGIILTNESSEKAMTENKVYDIIGAMKTRGLHNTKSNTNHKQNGEFVTLDKIEEKYGVRFTMPKAIAELMLVKVSQSK